MNTRCPRSLLGALMLVLAGCGLTNVDAAAPVSSEVDAAEERLASAALVAPYPVRLPVLPGFELASVDYIDEPADPTGHRFSLDVRMVGPGGSVLHVFQTNVSPEAMGATDPVSLEGSTDLVVGDAPWVEVTLPNGDGTFNTQLARRFADVTLSIDASDRNVARDAAATIAVHLP